MELFLQRFPHDPLSVQRDPYDGYASPVGVLRRASACPLHVRLFEKPVLAAAKHVPVRKYLQDFRLEALSLEGIRPA